MVASALLSCQLPQNESLLQGVCMCVFCWGYVTATAITTTTFDLCLTSQFFCSYSKLGWIPKS